LKVTLKVLHLKEVEFMYLPPKTIKKLLTDSQKENWRRFVREDACSVSGRSLMLLPW